MKRVLIMGIIVAVSFTGGWWLFRQEPKQEKGTSADVTADSEEISPVNTAPVTEPPVDVVLEQEPVERAVAIQPTPTATSIPRRVRTESTPERPKPTAATFVRSSAVQDTIKDRLVLARRIERTRLLLASLPNDSVRRIAVADSVLLFPVLLPDTALQNRYAEWWSEMTGNLSRLNLQGMQDRLRAIELLLVAQQELKKEKVVPLAPVEVVPPPPPPACQVDATVVWTAESAYYGPQVWGVENGRPWFRFEPRAEGHTAQPERVWFQAARSSDYVELVSYGDRWWAESIEQLSALGPGNWHMLVSGQPTPSVWGRGTNKIAWIPAELHMYIRMQPAWETYVDIFAPDGEEKVLEEFGTHLPALLRYRICPFNVGDWLVDFSGRTGVVAVLPEPQFMYVSERVSTKVQLGGGERQ